MNDFIIVVQRRTVNSRWVIMTDRFLEFDEAERWMRKRMHRAFGSWEYLVAAYKLDAVTALESVNI